MKSKSRHWINRHGLIAFTILTYATTYLLSSLGAWEPLSAYLPASIRTAFLILLHYSPSLVAILLVGIAYGRAGVKKLLRSLFDWRIGLPWYLFVLLYPLTARLLAVGIQRMAGGQLPAFFQTNDPAIPTANPLLLILPVFMGTLFQAGLAEEIGWRGFLLPRLQLRYTALTSSLILGLVWALWHFHPQNLTHLGPYAGWYILGTLSFTVIYTWVYNNTHGSLLIAVLLHAASNTSDFVVPINIAVSGSGPSIAFYVFLSLQVILAIILVVIFGGRQLTHQSGSTPILSRHPA